MRHFEFRIQIWFNASLVISIIWRQCGSHSSTMTTLETNWPFFAFRAIFILETCLFHIHILGFYAQVLEISVFVACPTSMVSSNCPLLLVLFLCSAFIGYTLSVTVIEYHLKHVVISFNDVVGLHKCPRGLATHDEQRFLRIHWSIHCGVSWRHCYLLPTLIEQRKHTCVVLA